MDRPDFALALFIRCCFSRSDVTRKRVPTLAAVTQNRAILILQMRCVAQWRIRAVREVGCLASGDRQPATLAGRRPARAAASVGTYPLIRHRHRQRQHHWAGLVASSHGHCRLHYRPVVTGRRLLNPRASTAHSSQLTALTATRAELQLTPTARAAPESWGPSESGRYSHPALGGWAERAGALTVLISALAD